MIKKKKNNLKITGCTKVSRHSVLSPAAPTKDYQATSGLF